MIVPFITRTVKVKSYRESTIGHSLEIMAEAGIIVSKPKPIAHSKEWKEIHRKLENKELLLVKPLRYGKENNLSVDTEGQHEE